MKETGEIDVIRRKGLDKFEGETGCRNRYAGFKSLNRYPVEKYMILYTFIMFA